MTSDIISTNARRKEYAAYRSISVAFLLILLPVLRSNSGQNILGPGYLQAAMAVMLFSIASIIVFHLLSRANTKAGKITLDENGIAIQLKTGDLNFKVNEISAFVIRRSFTDIGHMAVATISSYDNWILFEYNKTQYQYQFVIGSSFADVELSKLVDYWKEHVAGFKFETFS